MMIPKAFIPNKNWKKKIEELKESTHEVPIEELTPDEMRIIYGDSTWAIQLEILTQAVDKIVKDTFEGGIIWEKDNRHYRYISESYKAKATIPDYEGKPVTVPVFFFTDTTPIKSGFLYLGCKGGLYKGTRDKGVERLATDYFGIRL